MTHSKYPIPPYRFIDPNDIRAVFKDARSSLEPYIKRQYRAGRLTKQVAIDRQQVLVIAEQLLLAIAGSRMDPRDIIAWMETTKKEIADLEQESVPEIAL